MKIIIGIALIAVFFSLDVQAEQQYEEFASGQVVFPKHGLTINVEVAKTKRQRTLGLMYRENLAPNKGMLFIFDKEEIQRVWMKNTLISLDILFISAEDKIVSIIRNVQPCRITSCTIYDSKQKAKYMLEVNASLVAEKNITVAEKIRFNRF